MKVSKFSDAQKAFILKQDAVSKGLGRSRCGNSTKINLRTNAIGLPVAMTLSPGEVSDVKGDEPVMDEPGPMPRVLIAEKRYDSDALRNDLSARGVTPVIPHHRNRRLPEPIDGWIYSLRNRIERCFCRLKQNRRIATRYDKTANSFSDSPSSELYACGSDTLSTRPRSWSWRSKWHRPEGHNWVCPEVTPGLVGHHRNI